MPVTVRPRPIVVTGKHIVLVVGKNWIAINTKSASSVAGSSATIARCAVVNIDDEHESNSQGLPDRVDSAVRRPDPDHRNGRSERRMVLVIPHAGDRSGCLLQLGRPELRRRTDRRLDPREPTAGGGEGIDSSSRWHTGIGVHRAMKRGNKTMTSTIEEAITKTVQNALRDLPTIIRGAIREELLSSIRQAVREELLTTGRQDPDRLISVEQAAGILGMSVNAVRKAAQRRTLPVQRIGRRLRFRLGDLLLIGTVTRGKK